MHIVFIQSRMLKMCQAAFRGTFTSNAIPNMFCKEHKELKQKESLFQIQPLSLNSMNLLQFHYLRGNKPSYDVIVIDLKKEADWKKFFEFQ